MRSDYAALPRYVGWRDAVLGLLVPHGRQMQLARHLAAELGCAERTAINIVQGIVHGTGIPSGPVMLTIDGWHPVLAKTADLTDGAAACGAGKGRAKGRKNARAPRSAPIPAKRPFHATKRKSRK